MSDALDEAIRLLESDDPAGAAALLESTRDDGTGSGATGSGTVGDGGGDGGERDALLGLALFRSERYDEAAQQYRAALEARPDRSEWQQMLAAASANTEAEVDVVVPPITYFERDDLLAPPESPRLPAPARDGFDLGVWRRAKYAGGHAIGSVGGSIFGWLTNSFGKNYRGDVWTNWYRKRTYSGILTLAYMREKLNADNLRSTYPAGAKTAFQPDDLEPPDGVTHFRTADGSWNNLDDPKEGAAGTRFPRNVENAAIVPESGDEMLTPGPREISLALLTRDGPMKEVPFLNLLAASWIQFQNHDWVTHGENLRREIIQIPLADDDPARLKYRQTNMFAGRTQPDPTRQDTGEETPATFINEVTHWWDGSQIYGSDQATQDHLRNGVDGKLRVQPDGTLPLGSDGVEESGMVRNWWVGLAMLHNLFVLEHNAICDELKAHHPDWDDNRLFNVARLVNAAVMAKIHSVEWTPAILPNESLALGLNSNWYGMLTYRFRGERDRKTVAEYNVHNPEMGGLVGNHLDKHGSPFGLSEEFVEVYRLHSLLPEVLELRRSDDGEVIDDIDFVVSRQAGSPKVTGQVGMTDLFYSFGNQHPGQLVLNNFPRFMQELSIPGNPVFDMGAIDILRARERGVPRYNEFRRQLGLNPIRKFADLTDDDDVVRRIEDVYGDDVEKLDLLIGTLAEGHRPTGFGFGETMFQIFILNASRRLQADRFFTVDYREEIYTKEGMEWVDRATFKSVLLRHHPELAATGLANVKNAFEPWDTGVELDPGRHPLRAFDPELKKNPWKGDAVA
jgi:hypothetical protein